MSSKDKADRSSATTRGSYETTVMHNTGALQEENVRFTQGMREVFASEYGSKLGPTGRWRRSSSRA